MAFTQISYQNSLREVRNERMQFAPVQQEAARPAAVLVNRMSPSSGKVYVQKAPWPTAYILARG